MIDIYMLESKHTVDIESYFVTLNKSPRRQALAGDWSKHLKPTQSPELWKKKKKKIASGLTYVAFRNLRVWNLASKS